VIRQETILLVDDTPEILGQIQQLLVSKGYAVSAATSGEKAIKLLELVKPSLILLDIMMPGMDGFETCKIIKGNKDTAEIPLIFLSAITDSFDKLKAFSLGAVDYITKPVHMDELLVRVNTQLSLYNFRKELQTSNEILEETVQKRTVDLQKINLDLEKEIAYRVTVENELRLSLEEIEKINVSLKESKEKAEESDRLKTAFLSNMSHEIRTPMNAILGFADLLKEKDLDSELQQEYIGFIEKSGQRLLKIINELIDISKIEEGQMDLVLNDFSINSVFLELNNIFQPAAKLKGISLVPDKTIQSTDCIIHADEVRISQVLSNLLGNAIKFSESGSVTYGYLKKGDALEFYVRDTGVGIPMEMQTIIFERFRQVDSSHLKGDEGVGLGLCISKAFVELHGGKIWCDSELDRGSSFYFTIPYKTSEEPVEEANASEGLFNNSYKNAKVLVAEDDRNSFLLLNALLKSIGAEVLYARNGKEVVELAHDNSDISLILMDLKMPEMNGIDATILIKKEKPNIPIIAQSAFAKPEDIRNALKAGCNEYIVKPIDKRQLFELISKYIPS
jgi:signal transduction histidine kinase